MPEVSCALILLAATLVARSAPSAGPTAQRPGSLRHVVQEESAMTLVVRMLTRPLTALDQVP